MITKAMLEKAARQGLLKEEQIAPLLIFFNRDNHSLFNTTNVLYYMGAGLAIVALGLLFELTWSRFGGIGLLAASGASLVLSAICLVKLKSTHLVVPASLFAVLTALLVPVVIYGAQVALGFWPESRAFLRSYQDFSDMTLLIEIAALVAALGILFFGRYPLLMLPIAVISWFTTLTAADMIMGDAFHAVKYTITIWFGLIMIVTGLVVDIATRHTKDYAFWLYMAGMFCFWVVLMTRLMSGDVSDLFCFIINLLLITFGIIVSRRVFVIAGAIGSFFYVMHLANQFVDNLWLFLAVLAAVGLGIIWLGIIWQKHETAISQKVQAKLPQIFRELIENRQS